MTAHFILPAVAVPEIDVESACYGWFALAEPVGPRYRAHARDIRVELPACPLALSPEKAPPSARHSTAQRPLLRLRVPIESVGPAQALREKLH